MPDELIAAWSRANTAEMLWSDENRARGLPVVPLTWPVDRTPCAAVPLSRLDDVDTLPRHAAFTVHSGTPTPRTLVASGAIDVRWDLNGAEFVEHLLPQELAKHPPTVLRADSIMARRENWWWVPRVLVTLTEVHECQTRAPRTRPTDALLVRRSSVEARDAAPRADVITTDTWPAAQRGARVTLRSCEDTHLAGSGEDALVLGHRHSPDFERWERWERTGPLHGAVLHLQSGAGAPRTTDVQSGNAEPFGLLERFLHHRRVAKACRTGIARAEERQRRR